MEDKLQETKRRLRERYLGRAGIHAFGIRRSQDAICVYLESRAGDEEELLLQEIETEARPHRVIVVEQQPPKIVG